MKERPIPFKAPMVRAILAGTKTQTRRIVKPQPHEDWSPAHYGELHGYDKDGELTPDKVIGWGPVNDDGECGYRSPYGQPGDQLWVREAWRTHACFDAIPPRDLTTRSIHYEANGQIQSGKLRPGMFMPRWASRITLEVTGVRVERLQDITRGDAMAEGCPFPNMAQGDDPRQWYADLWDQINGLGAWAANPWVWVVEFKPFNVEVQRRP